MISFCLIDYVRRQHPVYHSWLPSTNNRPRRGLGIWPNFFGLCYLICLTHNVNIKRYWTRVLSQILLGLWLVQGSKLWYKLHKPLWSCGLRGIPHGCSASTRNTSSTSHAPQLTRGSIHHLADASRYLPCVMTSSTARLVSCAIKPITEKMTNPPKKLVPQLMRGTSSASLKTQWTRPSTFLPFSE